MINERRDSGLFFKSAVIVFLLTGFTLTGLAQAKPTANAYGLPQGAVVVEVRSLVTAGHGDRSLILWMLKPKRYPRTIDADGPYTCPEETRGNFFQGPTRVSLFNTLSKKIINTVEIQDASDGTDSFDIPYKIRDGYYYHVEGAVRKNVEAKPQILWLRDYNGDGRAMEFALFDAWACMGLETTLIGYSEIQDKVVQYPIDLQVVSEKENKRETLLWADYLFSKTPRKPGYWKYEIDYRGRGGSLDRYEVTYNRQKESFEGKLVINIDK